MRDLVALLAGAGIVLVLSLNIEAASTSRHAKGGVKFTAPQILKANERLDCSGGRYARPDACETFVMQPEVQSILDDEDWPTPEQMQMNEVNP